jgi:hypothetical protein
MGFVSPKEMESWVAHLGTGHYGDYVRTMMANLGGVGDRDL